MRFYIIPEATYTHLKARKDVQNKSPPPPPPPPTPAIQESSRIEDVSFESGGKCHDDFIIDSFPKSSKDKALRLLNFIKRYPEKIEWSSDGNVKINGEDVENANIIDLLRTAVNGRKKKPVGWYGFHQALREINTPISLMNDNDIITHATQKKKLQWITK